MRRDEPTREGYRRSFHYIAFWRLTPTNPGEFASGIPKIAVIGSEVRKVG
jgi:hypothetical protein